MTGLLSRRSRHRRPDTLQLDLPDFLSLIEGLSTRAGHRIDDDDYPKLAALATASAFIAGRGSGLDQHDTAGRRLGCHSSVTF